MDKGNKKERNEGVNIPHIGLSEDEKLPPEKEIGEYLIQFRNDDVLKIEETKSIIIDIKENSILEKILFETKEKFRTSLRDGVISAFAYCMYEEDDLINISKVMKRMRNKIDIELIVEPDTNIRELVSENMEGEIITFDCEVANFAGKMSIGDRMTYICPECENTIEREYKEKSKYKCSECMVLMEEHHLEKGEGTRRATLKEIIFDYDKKVSPFEITADFFGWESQKLELSKNVTITGVFRSLPLRLEKGKVGREFIPTVQVISFREKDDGMGDMPSPDLLEKFKKLEEEGKLVDMVIDSYAYNVYARRMEKKAVICSMLGSVNVGSVGNGIPPMIHILFVGDPETFKSTVMKYSLKVFGKIIRADSSQITNNGLKAIGVQMPDGKWAIRAGLLAKCNDGVLYLEEFGELNNAMYDELKFPMTEGYITKYVGGQEFNGKAMTGVWATMNPLNGVWKYESSVHDNLIPPLNIPIITRFDYIAVFSKESPDFDKNEISKYHKQADTAGKPDGLLSDEELRLFINHARTFKPVLTEDVIDYIDKYFNEIDKKREEKKMTTTDIRTKNGIKKFTIALSKWHGKDRTSIKIADEALAMFEHSMATLGMDVTKGEVLAEGSIKKTVDGKRNALKLAYDSIKDDNGYCFEDKLIEMALTYNVFYNRDEVKIMLNKMMMEGMISTKNHMYYITWT